MSVFAKDVQSITLDDIKLYLRIDYEHDDPLLETFHISAISFIQNYLNIKFDDFGEDELPKEFTICALALISHWYENRAVVSHGSKAPQEIPFVFKNILDYHRSWSITSGGV